MLRNDPMTADEILRNLCTLFNQRADISYAPDTGEWRVCLPKVYPCSEGDVTTGHDATERRLRASGQGLVGTGASLDEAVAQIEKSTVGNGSGFMISSQSFGMYRMSNDTCIHTIDVYEGWNRVETFAYDEAHLRGLIRKYEI